MIARFARPTDKSELVRMRLNLWPDAQDEHEVEIQAYFDGKPSFIDQIIVCEDNNRALFGFAELRIRNYAEGSEKMAVPYLEGWYVDESGRGQGAGRLLISEAEKWARSRGYHELASDTDIENQGSIRAHLAIGFQEVERAICFLKKF